MRIAKSEPGTMRSAIPAARYAEWSKAPIVTNSGGEICRRGRRETVVLDREDLEPDARKFIERVDAFTKDLGSADFRIYSHYWSERSHKNRIYLQLELFHFADDIRFWAEVDTCALTLGAMTSVMDRGVRHGETRAYLHLELLWEITSYAVTDALALKHKIIEELRRTKIWNCAGHSVL